MLAAGVKSTAAHAQAPTGTKRQIFRTLGRTKSNEFSLSKWGGQKGDKLEKTNDSRMPILCSHAFACCGGSEPNLRFQPGWTTDHKCRFRRLRSDDRLRQFRSSSPDSYSERFLRPIQCRRLGGCSGHLGSNR